MSMCANEIRGKYLSDTLTRSECDIIVQNALGPNVITLDYRLKFVSHGNTGFLGEYFKLHVLLKYHTTGKCENHTFFVKSLPITNKNQRDFVDELGVFKCETFLCGHLFPELKGYRIQKWCPEYYLTRSDIIVMEDLFKNGYSHMSDGDFLNIDQIKAVLKCISRMHANSINFEYKTGIDISKKYPVLNYECSVNIKQGWFRAGLRGIQLVAEMHPKFQTNECKAFVKDHFRSSLDIMFEKVKPSKTYKNVLCHRDAWGRNIFFKTVLDNDVKRTECLFVDFQMSRYLPASMDVLFFLHLNVRRQYRDERLNEYLQFYYENLSDLLKEANVDINEIMTWENFLDSCEYIKLVPMVLTGIYIPTYTYNSKEFMKLRQRDPDKYHQYISVDRNDFIRQVMERDSYFREYMYEVVGEILEYAMALKYQ